MTNSGGARSGRLVRFAIALTAIGLALPAAAAAAGTDTYIVQLKDKPLASYTGGKQGIPATSPKVTHNKLKPDSAPGLDYRAYLASRQKAVLNRVAGATPAVVRSYRFAFAGFAAKLTADQAARLGKDAGRRPRLQERAPAAAAGRPGPLRTRASAASTATAPPTCASATRPRACGRSSAAPSAATARAPA